MTTQKEKDEFANDIRPAHVPLHKESETKLDLVACDYCGAVTNRSGVKLFTPTVEWQCMNCNKWNDYKEAEVVEHTNSQEHPLVNEDSPHYKLVDGSQSIYMFEQMFTREELMAWAKITSFKYRMRISNKGINGDIEAGILSDAKKMKTYEEYYQYLKDNK